MVEALHAQAAPAAQAPPPLEARPRTDCVKQKTEKNVNDRPSNGAVCFNH